MKPQILIYGNRKQEDMTWVMKTPKEKQAAFLELFKFLRDTWKVYGTRTSIPASQLHLYDQAEAGNGAAAIRLLTMRKTYEYEIWRLEDAPAREPGRESNTIVQKPFYGEIKEVRVRREGMSTLVTLKGRKDTKVDFLIVPHMTSMKDWDEVQGGSYYLENALQTAYKRDMHNGEELRKALNVINEMRIAMFRLKHPETASELSDPNSIYERIMREAEGFLTDNSNSPLEKLTTKKRRPTTLEEAQEELMKARRVIREMTREKETTTA